MTYPEPSRSDCGAPFNEVEIEDQDGNIYIICGCSRCHAARKKLWREEREIEDDWV